MNSYIVCNMRLLFYIVVIALRTIFSAKLCPNAQKVYDTELVDIGDGIKIGFGVICETEEIIFKLKGPANKWFGIVFNKEMYGDAIIYTTGKDNDKEAQLYNYWLEGSSTDLVQFDEFQFLEKMNQTIIGNTIYLTYNRSLNSPDKKDRNFDSDTITFRYAIADPNKDASLKLSYHSPQGRSKKILKMDLNSGKLRESTDVKWVLHIVHGILMWIVWAVLAPLTIFIARNRHLWNENEFHVPMIGYLDNDDLDIAVDPNKWFQIHRAMGIIIMSFSVVSLSLIIAAVEDSESTQSGDEIHHILGFIVNALLCLQVVFALLCRPKKAKNGEAKSMKRKIWHILHGCNGVLMYVLANINIVLGILLKGEIGLAIVHIVWSILVSIGIIFFEFTKRYYRLYSRPASSILHHDFLLMEGEEKSVHQQHIQVVDRNII